MDLMYVTEDTLVLTDTALCCESAGCEERVPGHELDSRFVLVAGVSAAGELPFLRPQPHSHTDLKVPESDLKSQT